MFNFQKEVIQQGNQLQSVFYLITGKTSKGKFNIYKTLGIVVLFFPLFIGVVHIIVQEVAFPKALSITIIFVYSVAFFKLTPVLKSAWFYLYLLVAYTSFFTIYFFSSSTESLNLVCFIIAITAFQNVSSNSLNYYGYNKKEISTFIKIAAYTKYTLSKFWVVFGRIIVLLRPILLSFIFFIATCFLLKDQLKFPTPENVLQNYSTFFIEILLSTALFDLLESYKIQVSGVFYDSFLVGSLVFFSKLFIVGKVLEIIYESWKVEKKIWALFPLIRQNPRKHYTTIKKDLKTLIRTSEISIEEKQKLNNWLDSETYRIRSKKSNSNKNDEKLFVSIIKVVLSLIGLIIGIYLIYTSLSFLAEQYFA